MENKQKIIVIGLDGATWDLIKPWANEGKLPNFKHLMENGSWGVLESTIPPLSPSAWTSIYTGCKPSKHGIFGFVKRGAKSYFYRPISSKDVNKPKIWDILSDYGKRSIVINALFSYPPDPLDGIIITGLGTPSKESDFVYPKSYKEKLLKNFPKYDVDFNEDLLLVSDDPEEFKKKIEDGTIEQIKITRNLIETEKWDFLFSIFRALDVIQHYFWSDEKILFKYYQMYDDFLGELLQNTLKDDYNLFLVSDHGFSSVKAYFCVNNWLEKIDILKTNKTNSRSIITAETFKKFFLNIGMRDFVWKIKRNAVLEKILKIIPSEEFGYVNEIQWNETKAYYYEGSDGIININLKGREPSGIVSKEEYNEIVSYIINELKQIKDPNTNEKVIKNVYSKKELYGVENENIPDIFIQMEEGYRAVGNNKVDGNSLFTSPIHGRILRPGDHHINGIFMSYGNNITNNIFETSIKTWDIVPTILNILGLPVQIDLDGKCIQNIHKQSSGIERQFIKSHRVNEKEVIKRKIKKLKLNKINNVKINKIK